MLLALIMSLACVPFAFCATSDPPNAGTNIAPLLEMCYNDTRLLTRDYRLPATIQTLIDLIRKIETKSPNLAPRELSVQLLQRFRQDGIIRTHKVVDSSMGLPYSPRGIESFKNRVQLKILTPATTVSFDESILTPLESCTLHFLLSSSIETQVRDDESVVCNGLSRYTSRITKRNSAQPEPFYDTDSRGQSNCPLESGVVWTKWGAVKAGLLISGIAAGLTNNNIPVATGVVDALAASTLVGELSEVALIEPQKVVGNSGSWNDTVQPKYYFVEQNDRAHLVLTDAEIRGGIDGYILGSAFPSGSQVKISQVLELYYSTGLFNNTIRACNRKSLFEPFIQDPTYLINQVTYFNTLLDAEASYGYTPIRANFGIFAENATNTFITYFKSNLNDLNCAAEADVQESAEADLIIFMDASWDYSIIGTFISNVLQNSNVNKYGTSYAIYDGKTRNAIVNKTTSLLDLYENFNRTQLQKYPSGFDYTKVINLAQELAQAKLNNATDLTGQAIIVLLLPRNPPTATESTYFTDQRENLFKNVLPDVRFLVGATGTASGYNSLVSNPTSDIVTLPDNTDQNSIKDASKNLIQRLSKLPGAVINPTCGSTFKTSELSSYDLTQYVDAGSIVYSKISPNYFYNGGSLSINGQNSGTGSVCISRTDPNVRANTTGADCDTITSGKAVTKDLSSYCTDESVVTCSPVYISIEGTYTTDPRCSETGCRSPNSIKYTISLKDSSCNSGVAAILSSAILVLFLFCVHF